MPFDNIYWNPSEYEYEEPLSTFSKSYVDPWDLENYAYIKQYLGSSSDGSSEESSFGDSMAEKTPPPIPVRSRVRKSLSEPLFSQRADVFKYRNDNNTFIKRIPAGRKDRETEDFYGVVDFDIESETEDTSFGETMVSTKDNSFTFISNRRDLPNRSLMSSSRGRNSSYSFGDQEYDRYLPVNDVYTRLNDMVADSDKTIPIYDDVRHSKPHFRLSKCGHLQIDYSWSWNNLDKYIYN